MSTLAEKRRAIAIMEVEIAEHNDPGLAEETGHEILSVTTDQDSDWIEAICLHLDWKMNGGTDPF